MLLQGQDRHRDSQIPYSDSEYTIRITCSINIYFNHIFSYLVHTGIHAHAHAHAHTHRKSITSETVAAPSRIRRHPSMCTDHGILRLCSCKSERRPHNLARHKYLAFLRSPYGRTIFAFQTISATLSLFRWRFAHSLYPLHCAL